jgi:ABC-type uncharacterized transport system permease subunit
MAAVVDVRGLTKTFTTGRRRSRRLVEAVRDMFAGVAKLVVHSVLPAAFVAAVPARLVDSFDTGQALALGAAATTFALAGWLVFTVGLRRYTSGSVWTRP